MTDSRSWTVDADCRFTVKPCYDHLVDHAVPSNEVYLSKLVMYPGSNPQLEAKDGKPVLIYLLVSFYHSPFQNFETAVTESSIRATTVGMGISSEDLLYEIFVRLPLVSLLRFKSVSKSWYFLILKIGSFLNHKNDISNYREVVVLLVPSHDNPVDLIVPGRSVFSIFRLNLFLHMSMIKNRDEQHLDLVLHNSCNGLLLYHQRFSHSKKHKEPQFHYKCNVSSSHDSTVFYVCNPIAKHYFKLPDIELKDVAEQDEYNTHMWNTRKACIVFDPSVSLSYKVIRCCVKREACYNHHVLYVYSSQTRSWKLLTRFTGSFKAGFQTVMFNGVFYWYAEVGDVCLCFDIENENVWFPPLPTSPYIQRTCLYFGETGGKLRLIENIHFSFDPYHLLRFPCSFNIMEMEQQEDGRHCVWKVKYHVNINGGYDHIIQKLPKLQHRMPFEVCIMHMYKMTTKEEEEALVMNIVGTNKVITYNITSNTFGPELIVIPNLRHRPVLRGIIPYTPTLVPACILI